MDLVTPGIGMIIWTAVTFILLVILLGKFAWRPILKAVTQREEAIEDALAAAEKAKEEMASLNAENERILAEARAERDGMLKEAREMKDKIINDAKEASKAEGDKMIESARAQIQNEKMAALTELKNQVGKLSLEIAEKVLREELKDGNKQNDLVGGLLEEVKLN